MLDFHSNSAAGHALNVNSEAAAYEEVRTELQGAISALQLALHVHSHIGSSRVDAASLSNPMTASVSSSSFVPGPSVRGPAPYGSPSRGLPLYIPPPEKWHPKYSLIRVRWLAPKQRPDSKEKQRALSSLLHDLELWVSLDGLPENARQLRLQEGYSHETCLFKKVPLGKHTMHAVVRSHRADSLGADLCTGEVELSLQWDRTVDCNITVYPRGGPSSNGQHAKADHDELTFSVNTVDRAAAVTRTHKQQSGCCFWFAWALVCCGCCGTVTDDLGDVGWDRGSPTSAR